METFSFDQARWFAEEVQPHEAALRAYLRARFPSVSDHDDIVQETYSRLLRTQTAGHVRYAKAFLFTTASNAALDCLRRRKTAPMEEITDFRLSSVLEERPNAAEIVSQRQEMEILAEALHALPDRCRKVVMLRYMNGLSYKEIAIELNISPETVKVHLTKGLRRCAEYLENLGLMPPTDEAKT